MVTACTAFQSLLDSLKFSKSANLTRGIIIFPVSIIGVVFNWTVVLVASKNPILKHSFGLLTANQAVGDAIHSTACLLYIFPMLIFDIEFLKVHSNHVGFLLLFAYEASMQTHFLLSVNRLLAAFTPLGYGKIFSHWNTKVAIQVVWVNSFISTSLFYEVLCSLEYSDEKGFFVFTDTPFCHDIGWFADFCKYLLEILTIFIIDVSTIVKFRRANRKVRDSLNSFSTVQNRRRELNFLRQTVLQGSVFSLELISYFVISGYLENSWLVYLATTFAWVLVHAIDGVITISCNPEFKNYAFKFSCRSPKVDNQKYQLTISGSQSTAPPPVIVIQSISRTVI